MEHVLIAEDSATQRDVLRHALETAGYRVRAARDGAEALRLAEAEVPDVVVTDIVMPNLDGYGLCRALKQNLRFREVPVVLLTGLSDPGDVIAGLQCGADSFIGKPFDDDYLLSRLREVLANRKIAVRESADGGIQVRAGGQSYTIHASRPQILDLLLSVYDAALRRNRELQAAERELLSLNRGLEQKFREREELLERERAARREAERANRLKEEFLATVSHELRTPLSAIAGWVQFIRQDSPTPEDLREALAVIERNTWAQTQIVDDLLDMSRIGSGKIRLDVTEVSLRRVIQAGLNTVETAADARRVELRSHFEVPDAHVRGDEGRLQQVVWNLLSNAVKFTPEGGHVSVALRRVENSQLVEIEVRDTGAGIEPAFLPHVFDRFSQSDSSTTRKHGGLGLGLAIARHLVELHGGTIEAASDGKDRGACFTVRLPQAMPLAIDAAPARTSNRPPTEATVAAAELPRLDGLRVLVVDDVLDARVLVERLLRDRGAEVEVAASVSEAFEYLGRSRFSVVISDIGMPQEDGYHLIERLRRLPPESGGTTPALALTAFARLEDRHRALRAGFEDYLSKPINTAELVRRVADLARPAAG